MRSALSPLVLLVGLALTAAPLTGSSWTFEKGRLVAADEEPLSCYGDSVAVSGDTAIVGACGVNHGVGAAYIYVRTGAGWSLQARLVPSEVVPGIPVLFGVAVEISGETAFVGAWLGNASIMSGAVYVFVRNGATWTEQAKLVPADGFTSDAFGVSLAVSGDTLVVGAPNSDSESTVFPRGAVYVYVRNGTSWSLQAKLLASDGSVHDSFGASVSISGDTLVVGAHLHSLSGAVYVFRRSGSMWQEQTELSMPNGELYDSFGYRSALSGNLLMIGAPGSDRGAVHVFEDNGSSWSLRETLLAPDATLGDSFGRGLALSGDTLVVGAMGHSERRGAAYVFVRHGSTWSEHARLHASDGKSEDWFGDSVAISGGMVLVGAYRADDPGVAENVGAVYLFDAPGIHVAPTEILVTQGVTPFSVALDIEPTDDVVIDLESSGVGEGTVSPTRLTFTPGNWSAPQTVSLTRVAESGPPYTIALSMNHELTGDAFYNGLDPEDVSAIPLEFAGDFYTVTFCRVLDTRLPNQGPPLTGGGNRMVAFHDTCGVPATARAVALAVTVVQPTRGGHLTLYPSDFSCPGLEQLAFSAGRTRTINAIIPLATGGTGTLTVAPTVAEAGSAHLVIDISGYFE